jgi:hypothetical protein
MQNNPTPKIGDRFENPLTGKINKITHIESRHWYPRTNSYGPYYKLDIEGTTKSIELTPAMLQTFKKL